MRRFPDPRIGAGRAESRRGFLHALPAYAYLTFFFALPLVIVFVFSFASRGRTGRPMLEGLEPRRVDRPWDAIGRDDRDSLLHAGDPQYDLVSADRLSICLLDRHAGEQAHPHAPAGRSVDSLLSNFLVRTYAWRMLLDSDGYITQIGEATGLWGRTLFTLPAVFVGCCMDTCRSWCFRCMRRSDRIAAFNSAGYWDLLITGEVVVAQGWTATSWPPMRSRGVRRLRGVGYAIPIEGSAAWVDTMAIPTTAEHPCTAQSFINYMLDAENGAELTNYNYYASPNAASEAFIYEEILEDPSIYPTAETMQILEFFEDLGDFGRYYADAYSAAKG